MCAWHIFIADAILLDMVNKELNLLLFQALFQIEHGVCTKCNLDCHELIKCLRPLSKAHRKEYIEKVSPQLAQKKKL